MFRFRILFFCLLAFSMMIVSCTKDNIDETDVTTPTIDPSTNTVANALVSRANVNDPNAGGLELDCIDVLFPFELIDVDGNTFIIASGSDFEELMMDSASIYIVDFVYPLNISIDGEIATVNNGEELGEAFAACLPDGGWTDDYFPAYEINFENSCYALSYPVSLQKPDGTIVVANSEDEFIDILVREPVGFVFPLTLVDIDGNTITVGDVDDLFNTLISCNGSGTVDSTDWNTGFEYIGCYLIQFPFNVIDADGNIIQVNNHQEYCDLLLTGQVMAFAYPLTLTDEEGTVITVNSEDELYAKLDECHAGGGGGGNPDLLILMEGALPDSSGVACYTIMYPIQGTFINDDGSTGTITFNSDEEVLNFPEFPMYGLAYPVTVVTRWDQQVILEDQEDLFELFDSCF